MKTPHIVALTTITILMTISITMNVIFALPPLVALSKEIATSYTSASPIQEARLPDEIVQSYSVRPVGEFDESP